MSSESQQELGVGSRARGLWFCFMFLNQGLLCDLPLHPSGTQLNFVDTCGGVYVCAHVCALWYLCVLWYLCEGQRSALYGP